MKTILIPLVVTLALEAPIAVLWGLRRRDLALFALVNLLTNPLANLIHLFFPSFALLFALECAVVWMEGALYRSLGERVRKPFLLSLCANAASFILGGMFVFFLQIHYLGWF